MHYILILIALSLLPYLYLFTQMHVLGGIAHAPGNIIALLAATLMWWQFTLSNRFLMATLDPNYVKHLSLHKKIGKYAIPIIFFHPLWQMYNYAQNLFFIYFLNFSSELETYISLGRLAYFIFIIIFITSALLRSRLHFRPWLYLHYLNYLMMFFIFLHASKIGTYLNTFPLLRLYWLFFAYSYFALLAFRLLTYLNLNRHKYKLIVKKSLTSDITLYTFKPLKKPITPKVGQFIYLRPHFFAEAHPFTAMKYNHADQTISLAIKSVGPFTRKLVKLKKNAIVYLDGPYGVFTVEGHNNNPKVIIAGGIGITPFVNLINKYANHKTYLFYANRTRSEAIFRKTFKSKLKNNYIDALSQETLNQKLVVNGRINKDDLKKYIPTNLIKQANFFVCGSPNFMQSIISDLSSLGINKDQIFFEEFSL